MSRPPLFSQNLNVPVPFSAVETPAHGKISTPPHSVYAKRTHAVVDTPVRTADARGLLMLPAFSSPPPQPPVFQHPTLFMKSPRFVAPATDVTPFLAPAVSGLDVLLAQLDDAARKKRTKKLKRDARDAGFSLDSAEKPPYLYATLIGMSILTHPHKQLTLLQIYTWISETFKYYRREDVGWQNLIRHNLSLNKAFVKGAKSKDGKGHFWCIKPECEDLFLKAKNNKKSLYHEVMDQLALARRLAALHLLPLSPPQSDDRKRAADYDDLAGLTKRARPASPSSDLDNDTAPDEDTSLLRTPAPLLMIADSPDKPLLAGKHLTFASSFSCSLNFELLPIPALETGPLLETLAPALLFPLPAITLNRVVSHHLPQLQPPFPSLASPSLATPSLSTPRAAGTARTPKSGTRTPHRTLKTPQSGTVMRKLWNSPSYLEEFYYLPFGPTRAVLNSYDDDDMLMRAFDSPAAAPTGRVSLLHELKKADLDPVDEPPTDADASPDSD